MATQGKTYGVRIFRPDDGFELGRDGDYGAASYGAAFDIAGRLVLSPATVKTHVNRAMMKLGARDRAHLVVFAYEAGLVRPGWAS